MKAPESPLDKKTESFEEELTLEERVKRVEITFENAFNSLGKYTSELDMRVQDNLRELQHELSKTLTLMNMSTLQNIVTMRETLKILMDAKIVDGKVLEEKVNEELKKAIELQQQAIADAQAPEAEATQSQEAAPLQ